MQCYTQEEIANEVGCDRNEVKRFLDGFGQNGNLADLTKSEQSAAEHATDFELTIDKDAKEARNKRIFDLWMQCYTQEEIASAVNVSQGEVAKNIPNGNIAEWNKLDKSSAEHATDFELPILDALEDEVVGETVSPTKNNLINPLR